MKEQDKNKDKLESFFQSRLEGYEEAPDAGLWGRISLQVPPPPVSFWTGIMSRANKLLFPLLLGAALALIVWQWNKTRRLEEQIKAQEVQLSVLFEKIQEINLSEKEGQKEGTVPGLPEYEGLEKENIEETAGFTDPSRADSKGKEITGPAFRTSKPGRSGNKETGKTGGAPFRREAHFEKEIIGKQNTNLRDALWAYISDFRKKEALRLALLPAPAGKVSSSIKPANLSNLALPKMNESGNSLSFFYGLEGGVNWSRLRTSYQEAAIPAQGLYSGLRAGLQFRGGWEVFSGMGISSLSFSREINRTYRALNEAFVNGESTLETSFDLGFMTFDSDIRNNGSSLDLGDPFSVRWTAPYQLRYLNIPIGLSYSFGSRATRLKLGGGLNWHILLSEKLQTPRTSFSHAGLESVNARADSRDVRSAFLEGQISAGAVHAINRHWEIQAHLTLGKPLSNIIYNQPIIYGVQTGIRFRL